MTKENTVKKAELAAAKVLDERIKAAGAETVIYATWGNNTGAYTVFKMNSDGINASSASTYSISRADHTAYMKSISEEFAKQLGAPMVDCASLFEFMVTKYPDINMYHSDERHPSLYGSYAIACTFYAHFYNESPVGAAALYHDVGKLHYPEHFTENQGDYNLHDELTPELSADIIRSHAKDGYTLIRNRHLPDFLADVALEHQGTMPIRYFYAKALKMTDGELNIEDFSYMGP